MPEMNPADVPDELVQAVWENLFAQPRTDDVEALIAEINDKDDVRLAIAAVYAPVARYVRTAMAAELAAATMRAETAEAAYHRLDSEQAGAGSYAGRAEAAEAALAEQRGQREVQWATRIGNDSDGIPARYYPDDEWVCRRRAALGYGVPHHLVQRDIYPTPWRDAAATPHAALEQLAAEQGDNGGG